MKLCQTPAKLKAGKGIKIVALGDSLTNGWMVERGYLFFLEELIDAEYPDNKITIINRGIPGDTAENGLARFDSDVAPYSPDLLLIQFGLNDAFYGYSVKEFKANIIAIIEKARKHTNAELLLLTSSYLEGIDRKISNKFYRALEDISVLEEVPLALVHKLWEKNIQKGVDFKSLVQADLVHPTEKGYRIMAEAVFNLF